MEDTEGSSGALESPDLDPQLFINEILNCVDDSLDKALLFYHQQAAKLLKIEGSERTMGLSKGVACMGNKIRLVLDNNLGMWEKYSLRHCFKAPEGFSFSNINNPPGDALVSQDAIDDTELDTQLNSTRHRLHATRQESDELNRELQALEMESASDDHIAKIVIEVLEICEQTSAKELFQEMMMAANELQSKVQNLNCKVMEEKEIQRIKKLKMDYPSKYMPLAYFGNGLRSEKLGDLRKFLADLKRGEVDTL